jgi:hypothetical protein
MSDTPLQLDAAALGRAQEETLEEMLVVVDNIDFAKAVPKKSAEFVLPSAIIFMRVSYNACLLVQRTGRGHGYGEDSGRDGTCCDGPDPSPFSEEGGA